MILHSILLTETAPKARVGIDQQNQRAHSVDRVASRALSLMSAKFSSLCVAKTESDDGKLAGANFATRSILVQFSRVLAAGVL